MNFRMLYGFSFLFSLILSVQAEIAAADQLTLLCDPSGVKGTATTGVLRGTSTLATDTAFTLTCKTGGSFSYQGAKGGFAGARGTTISLPNRSSDFSSFPYWMLETLSDARRAIEDLQGNTILKLTIISPTFRANPIAPYSVRKREMSASWISSYVASCLQAGQGATTKSCTAQAKAAVNAPQVQEQLATESQTTNTKLAATVALTGAARIYANAVPADRYPAFSN